MGIAAISSLKSDRATCMQAGRGVALKSSSSEQAFRVLVNSKSESKRMLWLPREDVFGSINRNLSFDS